METKAITEDWDVLTSFFPEGWEKKAYDTRALMRRRKIDSPETLLRLLLIHLADGKSLRTTAAYASEANLCHINDAALLHRLRASGPWLRWMALSLLDRIDVQAETHTFARKTRVRLIDASIVKEPGVTGSEWRLHYSLNLENLYCDSFLVTDNHTGESFGHFAVQPRDLLIGDRGYCKRNGILHVLEHGGDVLVRYHSTSLHLYNTRGGRFNVLKHLRALKGTEIGDWNVSLFDDDGRRFNGRLCALRKSREAIAKTRKRLHRLASKRQHKLRPETLEYGEYVIVFTTVSRHRLRKAEVMELYRARWQIELSFKRLKGIMNLGHLPKIDPESSKAWLYGKLFVSLLAERMFQEAETFSPWGYPVTRKEEIE